MFLRVFWSTDIFLKEKVESNTINIQCLLLCKLLDEPRKIS